MSTSPKPRFVIAPARGTTIEPVPGTALTLVELELVVEHLLEAASDGVSKVERQAAKREALACAIQCLAGASSPVIPKKLNAWLVARLRELHRAIEPRGMASPTAVDIALDEALEAIGKAPRGRPRITDAPDNGKSQAGTKTADSKQVEIAATVELLRRSAGGGRGAKTGAVAAVSTGLALSQSVVWAACSAAGGGLSDMAAGPLEALAEPVTARLRRQRTKAAKGSL